MGAYDCVLQQIFGGRNHVIVWDVVGVFLLGGALGALIVWLVARTESASLRARLEQTQIAGEKSVEALLERAKNELRETTAARASERVGELVSPMTQKLGEFDRLLADLEAARQRDAGSLREQIDQLLGRAEKLESAAVGLTTQTSTLVTALRNPASRGRWGEMQLRNVVEKAGMLPHCDFTEQQSVALDQVRVRPDMTINLPGDRRVFVDAKAPTDSLQAALESADDKARLALVKQHARALRDHVDALARRGYQTAKGSADYVVMFVAGEAFLSYACTEDPALIEYALDKGVLISGPLTLVTLLRSFAMGWQALRQEENAKRIADMGRVLYERACKFSEHLAEMRKHLERSVNAFNAAVGSYETKLLPQGRRLKDEASLGSDALAEIPPIDVVPRAITALDTGTQSKRLPRSQQLFANDDAV
jgi:DNA recombination protein RmuC